MKKYIKLLTLGLILSIAFMTGCSNSARISDNIKKCKPESIKSAWIESATAGANPAKKYTFDLNNPDQAQIIKNIISEIKSAKVKGYTEEKVDSMGGSPAMLIIELKNGSVINIKSAVKDNIRKLSDGSIEITKSPIADEVTITTDSGTKPVNILAPDIKKLIDGGFQDIFR